MHVWNGVDRVWRMFVSIGARSRRTRLFVVLSLLAPLLQLLVVLFTSLPGMDFFNRTLLVFYLQLLVPLLALFFGTSVVNDELDDKTLVYLVTRPVPRPAILLGKFAAAFTLALPIAGGGFTTAYLLARSGGMAGGSGFELAHYLGVMALALFAYSAIFTLLGTFMKKAILFGLFFVFGWEFTVQFLPGVTQRLTLIHWIKSLLPAMPREMRFMLFHLEPSSAAASVLVLLLVGLLALATAALVFRHRAYVMSDSL